jgi:transposase
MAAAVYVRPVSCGEESELRSCVRGRDVFALRRAQMILGSAQGLSCTTLSVQVGQSPQMVRHVIHLFNQTGVGCLVKGSRRPKSAAPVLDQGACEAIGALVHRSPRDLGQTSSLWCLELLAQVAWEQGLTPRLLSPDTLGRALKRIGVSWKRAKGWITSPDTGYERKKSDCNVCGN